MQNDHIIFTGFVSDDELKELYRNCRLVVVPLRFGAGVKGKVVESIYYQCPTLTTPIGAEGLSLEAVSYTHLDVYKRQRVIRNPAIFRQKKEDNFVLKVIILLGKL